MTGIHGPLGPWTDRSESVRDQNFVGSGPVPSFEIFLGSGPVRSQVSNFFLVLVGPGWSGSLGPEPTGFGPWIPGRWTIGAPEIENEPLCPEKF